MIKCVVDMGLFSKKKQSQERRTKLPHSDLPPRKDVTITYTGGELSVTLQRAKSRFLEGEGPTRLVWAKNQRLGLTFVELPQGGVAVKDVPGMCNNVSPGQELIGINNTSVVGMSLQAMIQRLQAASSPCTLTFTPPPSPIVVSDVQASASRQGVEREMVLKSINGKSMIGATLSAAGDIIRSARESSPARLTFAPYDSIVRYGGQETKQKSRLTLRNTLCAGAIAALISL